MANEKRLIDANVLTDDTYILNSWDAPIVRAWLDDQPTVDAVEVVHGRWIWKPIQNKTWVLTCSVCGSEEGAHELYNYCPNCGAKMDGGNEDD
jgi:hypothetical protein